MRIGDHTLNAFQSNFLKTLMGEPYMSDVRFQNHLTKVCSKFDVDLGALLTAVNKNFAPKNEEFKKREAEELGLGC